MKTRQVILDKARELFNRDGLSQVTLREVAAALGRAYGNVTYHFPNKESLVSALYDEMQAKLSEISAQFAGAADPLASILVAPRHTFALSLHYLFLYRDYLDILRQHPQVAVQVQAANEMRKTRIRGVFDYLQSQGLLDPELQSEDIDYIMELSGAVRTFFFQQIDAEQLGDPGLAQRYLNQVNRLLYPYLSKAGKARYVELMG